MTCCVSNKASDVKQSYFSFSNIFPNLAVITGIALTVIGILALLEAPGLIAINDYWYLFELGALACFAVKIICCCKSLYAKSKTRRSDVAPPQFNQTMPNLRFHREGLPQPTKLFISGQLNWQSRDHTTAAKLYHEAWQQGSTLGGFALAECYEQGVGVTKDDNTVVCIYESLADENCLEAIFYLALRSFKMKNVKDGLQWLERAAAIDTNQDRSQSLKKTLELSKQQNTLINPDQFGSQEAQLFAIQNNQWLNQVQEETNIAFYKLETSRYLEEEKSKRNESIRQLI